MTRNSKSLVTIILAFFIVATVAPAAQAKPTAFGLAMKAYEDLDYDKAETLFLQTIASGRLSAEQMIQARQRLAQIYIATDKPDGAVEQYRAILVSDSGFTLPEGASPKLKQAFDTAQYKLAKEQKNKDTRKSDGSPKRAGNRKLGWTLAGVGAAALVGGGLSYVMAIDQNSKFQDAADTADADAYRNAGKNYETLGQALIGVGLASGGLGIYFIKTSPSDTANGGALYFAGTSANEGGFQLNFGMAW